jgi:hypothetical protein
MASDADEKLAALLERLRRLTERLTRSHADSAKTRKIVLAVERKIARARAALEQPLSLHPPKLLAR